MLFFEGAHTRVCIHVPHSCALTQIYIQTQNICLLKYSMGLPVHTKNDNSTVSKSSSQGSILLIYVRESLDTMCIVLHRTYLKQAIT